MGFFGSVLKSKKHVGFWDGMYCVSGGLVEAIEIKKISKMNECAAILLDYVDFVVI